MSRPRSDALVIFGVTGDLAFKKIFPALQAMVRQGQLKVPVIGVARGGSSLESLIARAKDSITKNGGGLDPEAFPKLSALFRSVDGDYNDPATYAKIRQALGGAQHPLYYLAIPPSIFTTVASGLGESGGVKGARVVVEKPFGRDLPSAQELNKTLLAWFGEDAIFRIDHYLGKEPVQNLLYYRMANPIIEASLDARQVSSVQITMAESFGVEGRGKFYEEAGAIRDVVQNHMLQVIACMAMDLPTGNGPDALRDERGKVLKQVQTLKPEDVVRGQFRGYLDEPGVDPKSTNETFAAVRFQIDSQRWRNVPFLVRAGKCMPTTATEVLVRFKKAPGSQAAPATYLRFRLSPEVTLATGALVKKPGEAMVGEPTELVACHKRADAMDPYQRLLSDASNGDPTLFAREDAVEQSWRIVDPILGDQSPVMPYEKGTWGPEEATRRLAPEGGWQNPQPSAKEPCR